MSEQQDRAAGLTDRQVSEHADTEQLLEGLDPEQPEQARTTGAVEGIAPDEQAAEHVEEMSDDRPGRE